MSETIRLVWKWKNYSKVRRHDDNSIKKNFQKYCKQDACCRKFATVNELFEFHVMKELIRLFPDRATRKKISQNSLA